MINVLHKKKDRVECEHYRGIRFVVYVGKALLKIVTTRIIAYCEAKELQPEEHRSMTDMIFTVRKLEELGGEARVPLLLFFVDLQTAYDFVDHTLL